jgi:hypothetical protein
MDLFSLILQSAVSWGVGRVLDTVTGCGRCGFVHKRTVDNHATSQLVCPKCQSWLDQYTNATQHTINRNRSVAAAYASNIHWEKWGGLWKPSFNPRFQVDCVNSKYEDLVVRFTLSKFQGSSFYQDEMILRPKWERGYWNDISWKVPVSQFPQGSGTFAVDVTVLNTWGDELHRARTLGDWARNG